MLEDLDVLNGELSIEFDPYQSIYTVYLNPGENKLDLSYRLKDNTKISVIGNDDLTKDKNEIVLTVYNDDDSESYYLYVYNNEDKVVFQELGSNDTLNVKKEEIWEYAVPVISSTCFLIILILFSLLFHKKKSK